MVSHNLQQPGTAETRGVKFSVEQRMRTAVMFCWPEDKVCYTKIDLEIVVAMAGFCI